MANPYLMTGIGAASATFFSTVGVAQASSTSAMTLRKGIKSFVPIVISGVLGIYGLIVAALLSSRMQEYNLDSVDGYKNFAAGLAAGLSCLASGSGVRSFMMYDTFRASQLNVQQKDDATFSDQQREPLLLDVHRLKDDVAPMTSKAMMTLCLLEAALGLYGSIVAVVLLQ